MDGRGVARDAHPALIMNTDQLQNLALILIGLVSLVFVLGRHRP